MSEHEPQDERRRHARYEAVVPLELRVELHGFGAADEPEVARGITVNMSLGGVLARVDRELRPESRCVAHFPEARERLGRTMVFGVVRRACEAGGGWEVAVLFDTPLQALPTATGTDSDF